jgi:hypothetical protein
MTRCYDCDVRDSRGLSTSSPDHRRRSAGPVGPGRRVKFRAP